LRVNSFEVFAVIRVVDYLILALSYNAFVLSNDKRLLQHPSHRPTRSDSSLKISQSTILGLRKWYSPSLIDAPICHLELVLQLSRSKLTR
jgi:hypothetical protein